jgi:hypothetical protein
MRNRFLSILAIAVLPSVAAAQGDFPAPVHQTEVDNTRYGGTAAQFLTLPGDARGAALGGSYSALVADVTSMFWNPGGLALIEGRQALFSYTGYVADTRHIWAGLATTLGAGDWAVGLSLTNFGFADQPVYTFDDQDGESGETYGVSETGVGLTASLQFSDRFSAGMTGRLVQQRLANTEASGFTVDFGTNYHTEVGGRPLRAAFAVLNFGPGLRAEGPELNVEVDPEDGGMGVERQPARLRTNTFEPPTQFRVAVAYDVLAAATQRLTVLSEFSQPNDTDPGFGLASEFEIMPVAGLTAALRLSYTYQADNRGIEASGGFNQAAFRSNTDEARWDGLGLGAGLGFQAGDWRVGVDYAFRHLGVLATVNMFSVNLAW